MELVERVGAGTACDRPGLRPLEFGFQTVEEQRVESLWMFLTDV